LQLKERVKVLQAQLDLQFAALDCWKATADHLPPELTLSSLSFDRRGKLTLVGTAPTEDGGKVTDFNDALRRATVKDQPLFSRVNAPTMNHLPGGQQLSWTFWGDVKRIEGE